MKCNDKLISKVTEQFLRERKFNIPIVFISQCYFKVPEILRLDETQ